MLSYMNSKKKMKVLELNTEKTWRGGERHTYYTVKAFKNIGIEVSILTRKGSPLAKKCKNLDVSVYEVNSNLEALKFLLLKGKEFDIIHAQTPKTQSVAVITKPFHKRPVVCTRLVDFKPEGFFSIMKYRLTDSIIALNETIKKVLEDIGVERIKVIPIMFESEVPDIERAKKFLQNIGIDYEKKKIIATVSALTPQKDPKTLIKAIYELKKIRNDFLFLHFGDGFMKEEIKKDIKNLNLEDTYKLLGFVEKPQDFYPLFDVFVMTSLHEGTPLAVLDAFFNKVPVVAVSSPALKETLEGRGILCPVKDPRCIAKSIDDLLSNRYSVSYITEKAYRWVKDTFSLERLAKEYVNVFKELL